MSTKPRRKLRIAVVVAGVAIALASAVLNGLFTVDLNGRIADINGQIAETEAIIADRHRLYALANQSRALSESYRNLLHIHSGSTGRVDERTLESFRNALYDTLAYGHQAANGEPPGEDLRREFDRWAIAIGSQEHKISRRIADRTRQYEPEFSEGGQISAGNFMHTRSEQIRTFWSAITTLDQEAADLTKSKSSLEGDRSLINNLAFSLQVFGLFVVLMKELL